METIIPMLATVLLATLALAVPVSAYNEADFQRFLKTKKCPNCNLSGIKLRCKKKANTSRPPRSESLRRGPSKGRVLARQS
jgi:hypothetical protein